MLGRVEAVRPSTVDRDRDPDRRASPRLVLSRRGTIPSQQRVA
jgi:hypothetical protein